MNNKAVETVLKTSDTESIDLFLASLPISVMDREVDVVTVCHGLEVLINYDQGSFVSMVTVDGVVLRDNIATTIVPKKALLKSKITLQAVITVEDVRKFRTTKLDLGNVLQYKLLEGFEPREDKQVIINPLYLWSDGKEENIEASWFTIGNMPITGCGYPVTKESITELIKDPQLNHTVAPELGFLVRDRYPTDSDAYPNTRIIFNQLNVG